MDKDCRGLRPRNDENKNVRNDEGKGRRPKNVIAVSRSCEPKAWQEAKQSCAGKDCHGLRPRNDESKNVIASKAKQSVPAGQG
jgi:hypothetical protein